MANGFFVLSLDVEIIWGTFSSADNPRKYEVYFNNYRSIFRRLVDILDEYEVPTTFAFVGHLLLDSCSRENGIIHPDVLYPNYDWYPAGWHRHDPGTDLQSNPAWYGTDILEVVKSARTKHEIGSHTFSHIIVDDPACTREIFLSQLNKCKALHEKHSLEFKSFVYPSNKIAHIDALNEVGIIAYRGIEENWYAQAKGSFHRGAHYLDRAIGITPPVYELPTQSIAPVNVPASMMLFPMGGLRSLIPLSSRVTQGKKGLQKAAGLGRLFHLWFHPHNLINAEGLLTAFRMILDQATELRDAGKLEYITMGDYAEMALRHTSE